MNTAYTIEDQERTAYMAGDIRTAELLARVAELEAQVLELEDKIEDTLTLEDWERHNGSAEQYKEFFFDCFQRLAGHYPCPDVSTDHDKSVIFDAIEGAENGAEALRDALYVALPFVEDHDNSNEYKPGAVSKALRKIRDALGEK